MVATITYEIDIHKTRDMVSRSIILVIILEIQIVGMLIWKLTCLKESYSNILSYYLLPGNFFYFNQSETIMILRLTLSVIVKYYKNM